LTRFYGVSADYLFGLTDNRQYRNVEIDKLHLSDEAISVLSSDKFNNRLLSELISNPDFLDWLAALEVFIDGSVISHINIVNAGYKVAIDKVTKEYNSFNRDEYFATLRFEDAVKSYIDWLRGVHIMVGTSVGYEDKDGKL